MYSDLDAIYEDLMDDLRVNVPINLGELCIHFALEWLDLRDLLKVGGYLSRSEFKPPIVIELSL